MVEYSKQYCEIHQPDLAWGFDIDEVITEIPHGYSKPLICAGFGFVGIGIDLEGNAELYFPKFDGTVQKIRYSKFIADQNLKSSGI